MHRDIQMLALFQTPRIIDRWSMQHSTLALIHFYYFIFHSLHLLSVSQPSVFHGLSSHGAIGYPVVLWHAFYCILFVILKLLTFMAIRYQSSLLLYCKIILKWWSWKKRKRKESIKPNLQKDTERIFSNFSIPSIDLLRKVSCDTYSQWGMFPFNGEYLSE